MNEDVERLRLRLLPFVDRLTARPPLDFRLRDPDGVTLGEILRQASDEALAGIVQLGVCRNAAIEVLLVCRYQPRLVRYFWALGVDEHTAEDLSQEVVLLMLRRGLARFDPDLNFESYLYAIARHCFVSRVCRVRRPILAGGNLEKPGPDLTTETAEGRELATRIDEAVTRLPEPERTVMELTIEGLSPREIAARLSKPVEIVYRLLNRARALVVERLRLELPPSQRGRPRKTAPGDLPHTPEPVQS